MKMARARKRSRQKARTRKTGDNKPWSVTRITDARYPGIVLRVSELTKDGPLYLIRGKKPGDKKTNQTMRSLRIRRAELGDTDEVQQQAARDLARKYIAAIARGEDVGPMHGPAPAADGSLTLSEAVDRYEVDGFHGRRESYRTQACRSIRNIAKFLQNKAIADLTLSDVRRYVEHRKKKDGVTAAAEFDVKALRAMLNWLVEDRLIERSPLPPRLRIGKIVGTFAKRRPAMTKERHEKLLNAAAKLPSDYSKHAFPVLLTLLAETAHRISAILALRWRDIDFHAHPGVAPDGLIHWYVGRAEDNKAYEHMTPMTPLIREALLQWREYAPGLPLARVFPAPRTANEPLKRSTVTQWYKAAEKMAKLEHIDGGALHMYRRGWNTDRNHMPMKVRMNYMGIRNATTLMTSYDQPEPAALLQVANYRP
jgi:integrase